MHLHCFSEKCYPRSLLNRCCKAGRKVIRTIKNGFTGIYIPNLFIYHPAKELVYNKETFKRAISYGGGSGRVARKHYNFYYQFRLLITPLIKMIFAFPDRKKIRFISIFRRWRGFCTIFFICFN
jgi:hypothetical protein